MRVFADHRCRPKPQDTTDLKTRPVIEERLEQHVHPRHLKNVIQHRKDSIPVNLLFGGIIILFVVDHKFSVLRDGNAGLLSCQEMDLIRKRVLKVLTIPVSRPPKEARSGK